MKYSFIVLLCVLAPLSVRAADAPTELCRSEEPALLNIRDMTIRELGKVELISQVIHAARDLKGMHDPLALVLVNCTLSGKATDLFYEYRQKDVYALLIGRGLLNFGPETIVRVSAGHVCNISLGYAKDETPVNDETAKARTLAIDSCIDNVLEELYKQTLEPEPESPPEEIPGVAL